LSYGNFDRCSHPIIKGQCFQCKAEFYYCPICHPDQFVCVGCKRASITQAAEIEEFYKQQATLKTRYQSQLARLEKKKDIIRRERNIHIQPSGHRISQASMEHRRQYAKLYHENHRDEIIARKRLRYQANKEKYQELGRINYQRSVMKYGLETFQARNRSRYSIHKDEIKAKRRQQYQDDHEEYRRKANEYNSKRRDIENRLRKLRRLRNPMSEEKRQEINRRRRERYHASRCQQVVQHTSLAGTPIED
jgi:hypothetical protein